MKSTKPTIIFLVTLFVGWFFIGIGYGDVVAAPLNSIFYMGGVVLFFVGLLGTVYLVFR
ncbi:MAG: hypothetical protein ABJH98_04085 [Reichenbachiella sp.]|uniref:hypothetical protein n=1 Tax=Reichenbachiella sp. TaxID=2184521 RepID=UPI00329935B2